jgi:hypothetical protein
MDECRPAAEPRPLNSLWPHPVPQRKSPFLRLVFFGPKP